MSRIGSGGNYGHGREGSGGSVKGRRFPRVECLRCRKRFGSNVIARHLATCSEPPTEESEKAYWEKILAETESRK